MKHTTFRFKNNPLRLLVQLAVVVTCLCGLTLSAAAYDGSVKSQKEFASNHAKGYTSGDPVYVMEGATPEHFTFGEDYATQGRGLYVISYKSDSTELSRLVTTVIYTVKTPGGVSTTYYLEPFDILSVAKYTNIAAGGSGNAHDNDEEWVSFTMSLPHCDEGEVTINEVGTMIVNGLYDYLEMKSDYTLADKAKNDAASEHKHDFDTSLFRITPVQGNHVYGHTAPDSNGSTICIYDPADGISFYARDSLRIPSKDDNGNGAMRTSGDVWSTTFTTQDFTTNFNYEGYAIELTTGADGYTGDGTVTVNYTTHSGENKTTVLHLEQDYDILHPVEAYAEEKHSGSYGTHVVPSFSKNWLDLDAFEMLALGRYSTDSFYYEDVCDTNMKPYTKSVIIAYLPKYSTINGLDIELTTETDDVSGDTTVTFQNIRVVKIADLYDIYNYWNGQMGLELATAYEGTAVLERDAANDLVCSKGTIKKLSTTTTISENKLKAVNYAVDSSGVDTAVTIKIADVQGAGFEGLLSDDINNLTYWWANGNGDAGHTYITPHYRFREALEMKVTYYDSLGSKRIVEVPFLTTYMAYLYHESSGLSAETLATVAATNKDYLIAGVFQQNETVGLPMRLEDYNVLQEITFTLGEKDDLCPEVRDYVNYREESIVQNVQNKYQEKLDDLETIKNKLDSLVETTWDRSSYEESVAEIKAKIVEESKVDLEAERAAYVGNNLFSYPMGWPEPVRESYNNQHDFENALAGYNRVKDLPANSWAIAVDAAVDPIRIESVSFYDNITPATFDGYHLGKLTSSNREPRTPLVYIADGLEAAFSYSSSKTDGTPLVSGNTLTINESLGMKKGSPTAPTYEETFLFEMNTAKNAIAGTRSDIRFYVNYTDQSGIARDSQIYSLRDLNAAYYGPTDRVSPAYDQYEKRAGDTGDIMRCLINLPGLATVNYVHLELGTDPYNGTAADSDTQSEYDDYQAMGATIYKISDIGQRYRYDGYQTMDSTGLYYGRVTSVQQLSISDDEVYLYTAGDSSKNRIIYFDNYVDGALVENNTEADVSDEFTTLPTSLTYQEACSNLGLNTIRHSYEIQVEVGDEDESGSANYFYFQLAFTDGTSGVVLANQQLASDTFRKGQTESFVINTTQYYGDVVSVRVICDNTASSSSVFDKLQVEKISVVKETSEGTYLSFVTDNIGWIDIIYEDEAAGSTLSELSAFVIPKPEDLTNGQIMKDYPIVGTATSVTLLFTIPTSASCNPAMTASPGDINCSIDYLDSSHKTANLSVNLIEAIQTFNDNKRTDWMFRPGHSDRFTVSLTNVSELQSITFHRSGEVEPEWLFDPVVVTLVPSLGDVTLSADDEYRRDLGDESLVTHIATTINTGKIPAKNQANLTFPENEIKFESEVTYASWLTNLSRIPPASTETVHTFLFGKDTAFTEEDGQNIAALVKYSSVASGGASTSYSATNFKLKSLGGKSVLYKLNDSIETVLSLYSVQTNLTNLSYKKNLTMDFALFQRIRGNVIVDSHAVSQGDWNLQISGSPANASSYKLYELDALTFGNDKGGWYTNQQVELQLSPNQTATLVPETSDIGIALQYTSLLDDSNTTYTSPYYFVTDSGETSISSSKPILIDMDVHGIRDIVGIVVASSCETAVSFTGATVNEYSDTLYTNYSKIAKNPQDSTTLLDTFSVNQGFTPSSIAQFYEFSDETMIPVDVTFQTPLESDMAGAASTADFAIKANYVNEQGEKRIYECESITSYLTAQDDTTSTLRLMLPGAKYVTGITLSTGQDDSWFIDRMVVTTDSAGQINYSCDTTVNNWVKQYIPLAVDVTPSEFREAGTKVGNTVNSINLTATSSASDPVTTSSQSASAPSSMVIQAYAGSNVKLTPSLTTLGNPDSTIYWTGSAVSYGNGSSTPDTLTMLTKAADGSFGGSFYVPHNAKNGDTFNLTVSSAVGDYSIAVAIQVTEKTVTMDPVVSSPDPATSETTTSEPSTSEPSTSEPSTSEPSTSEPSTSEPSTSEPSTSEPSTSEPATT